MSRPKGTGKLPERKYKGYHLKMPPETLERLRELVPPGERAEFVRETLERALRRLERDQGGAE